MRKLFEKGKSVVGRLFNSDKMDINETIEETGNLLKTTSVKEQGTRRHQNDMMSDSWLSKNIRPIIIIWLLSLFSFVFIGKAFGLVLDIEQTQTLGTLLLMSIGFYFPFRSAEKYLKNRSKKL